MSKAPEKFYCYTFYPNKRLKKLDEKHNIRYLSIANWIAALLEMEGVKDIDIQYDNETFNVSVGAKIPNRAMKIIKNYFKHYELNEVSKI